MVWNGFSLGGNFKIRLDGEANFWISGTTVYVMICEVRRDDKYVWMLFTEFSAESNKIFISLNILHNFVLWWKRRKICWSLACLITQNNYIAFILWEIFITCIILSNLLPRIYFWNYLLSYKVKECFIVICFWRGIFYYVEKIVSLFSWSRENERSKITVSQPRI